VLTGSGTPITSRGMPVPEHRAREHSQRRRLIISAARELAESKGWGAVTTRRLAEHIECSQPVLYKHFKNKDAVVREVALEGFAELAATLRDARTATGPSDGRLGALARAYTDFAEANAAVYEAMFTLSTDLVAGRHGSPQPLDEVFDEFRTALAPPAGGHRPDTAPEVVWSALHGMVVLRGCGLLGPGQEAERLELLVARFLPPVGPAQGCAR